MSVYFAQSVDGGTVKIGHSADIPARLKQLEAHYGQPVALLATLDGGREEEQVIHERFALARLGRTEQFRPVAEIMAFIGRPLLVGADPSAMPSPWSTDKARGRDAIKPGESRPFDPVSPGLEGGSGLKRG